MDLSQKKKLAIVIMTAAFYLMIQNAIGWYNMAAILFLILGLVRLRLDKDRLGVLLVSIGLVLFLFQNFLLILFLLIIALLFYDWLTRRRFSNFSFEEKKRFVESVRWDKESWSLKSTYFVNVIGEYHIDLSTALFEEEEPILLVQGLVGNVEVWIPDHLNVTLEISSLVGQVDLNGRKEGSIFSRIVWHSAPQEEMAMKKEKEVKIFLHFLIGHVVVKEV